MGKIILGLLLAVSLAMPDRAAAAEKYLIDSQVWGGYQQYLRNIGNGNKPGAFAISKDGRSAFYSWCQDIRCVAGPTYSQDALSACEREYGTDCVVFAVRDDIKVEYEIVANAPSAASSGQLEPAPMTKIAVTPDVQSDIDSYLRSVQSAGRMWAFAIAKDGSDGAMASCPVGSNYSGGLACDPLHGTMQELAKREALKRCGGPGDCVLLYVGPQKQGSIEIVAQ
jgi:hypothetical protein